jgi:hypothetical protein
MVLVREAIADDWQALRDIRLAALRDAPEAFASTYEQQVTFGEANRPARLLYERCGFTLTGERQPLPSHPGLGEIGMTFPL